MSLRARLIATLLVLAAAGMLVLAAVTYATQRSFQLERVDDQTRTADAAVDHQLDEQGVPAPGFAGRGPHFGGGPGFGGRGGPDPSLANLPPGTYGERRDASGKVLGTTTISYGAETETARPKLPTRLTPGQV